MGPRWKRKGSEAKALDYPMSTIISRLQSSLVDLNSRGLLSGSIVLLALPSEQSNLLNSACFAMITVEKDKLCFSACFGMITAKKEKLQFQLGMEEAFYLNYSLKCLEIFNGHDCLSNDLWQYMTRWKPTFPESYKAYSHLRAKNWVVRSGSQYGVDFVAYRHHPSLVHSGYAVLVVKEGDGEVSRQRLRTWSDVHCSVRLCGSVAKTLLVLYIDKCGCGEASPSCLDGYRVEERIVTRWSPQQCREDRSILESGSKP